MANDPKTLSLPVERRFLDKQECRAEARKIIDEGLIRGMSEYQLASEIYFHAVAYYMSNGLRILRRINDHADPIDIETGGDTGFRRAAFALCWIFPSGKKGK